MFLGYYWFYFVFESVNCFKLSLKMNLIFKIIILVTIQKRREIRGNRGEIAIILTEFKQKIKF